MSEILDFLINTIGPTSNPLTVDSLAERYVIAVLGILEDSVEFSSRAMAYSRRMINEVRKTNKSFERDRLELPFLIKGSFSNLIEKGPTFNILKESRYSLEENANEFAERVGAELLRKMGCNEKNIVITPKSADKGIDYWGKICFESLSSIPPHEVLVIGQVKRYSGTVPVDLIREFVGSVCTALKTNLFQLQYNNNNCLILQFVTTGEMTDEGYEVAKSNNIHIISKRHLIEMGILKSDY